MPGQFKGLNMTFEHTIERMRDFNSSKNQLTATCHVNDVRVFQTTHIWDEMAEKIRNASSNVSLCGYKFHGKSKSGKKIIDAFTELRNKATPEKPISVQLLINKRGKLAEKLYKKNYDAGLETLINEQEKYPNFKLEVKYYEARAFDSYHAKQVIIDSNSKDMGSVMFCGGDIQSENDNPLQQYETAVLVEGNEIAKTAQADFDLAFSMVEQNTNSSAPFPTPNSQPSNSSSSVNKFA